MLEMCRILPNTNQMADIYVSDVSVHFAWTHASVAINYPNNSYDASNWF